MGSLVCAELREGLPSDHRNYLPGQSQVSFSFSFGTKARLGMHIPFTLPEAGGSRSEQQGRPQCTYWLSEFVIILDYCSSNTVFSFF